MDKTDYFVVGIEKDLSYEQPHRLLDVALLLRNWKVGKVKIAGQDVGIQPIPFIVFFNRDTGKEILRFHITEAIQLKAVIEELTLNYHEKINEGE